MASLCLLSSLQKNDQTLIFKRWKKESSQFNTRKNRTVTNKSLAWNNSCSKSTVEVDAKDAIRIVLSLKNIHFNSGFFLILFDLYVQSI
mmetsp:Transcript_17136/g.47137  ORF Transcript_17136/g.47137 Transcript_17136/m.47137 type:complete len:89 (+) Transcript_17136:625-891(+)